MIKQFLKDSMIYSIAAIMTRGVLFFLLPVYTHWLSPSDFGVIDLLNTLRDFISVSIALEVVQGLARYLPDIDTYEGKVRYSSSALWFTFVVYIVFTITALFLSNPITEAMFHDVKYRLPLRLGLISSLGYGLFYLIQNQLRWNLKPLPYAYASLTYSIVSAGISIILIVGFKLGIVGVLIGQLIGNLSGLMLGFYYGRDSYRLQFDPQALMDMLRFSIALVPSSAGVFITQYIDRIAINHLLTLTDVGLFGVAYRISSVITLVTIGFQTALAPIIYTRYNDRSTPNEIAKIFRYFVTIALFIVLMLSLFAREILLIIAAPEYLGASQLIPFLVPAVLLSGLHVFVPGLGIAKRTDIAAGINIFGAFLNTGLNFALISIVGLYGAAVANLITAVIVFLLYLQFNQRYYMISYPWKRILLATGISTAIILAHSYIQLPLILGIILKTITLMGSAIMFFAIGLVTLDELNLVSSWVIRRLSRIT